MTTALQSIGQAVAGSTAQSKFQVLLPVTTSLVGAYAVWDLIDQQGYIWNTGNCNAISSAQSPIDPTQVEVSSTASIALPSNLVSNTAGTRYQIRYTLYLQNANPVIVFDTFDILPPESVQYGALSLVELASSNPIAIYLVVPAQVTNVTCQLQNNNSPVSVTCAVASGYTQVQGGYQYKATIPAPQNAPDFLVEVEPYIIVWNYTDSNGFVQTEVGELFMVNTSILGVIQEVQKFINRAYLDSGLQPGTTFKAVDVLPYLRSGRDQFNSSDMPTQIDMTNAKDGYRWFWIMYSAAAACRAQYLAEGMKSFNYAGQEVSLDVDRSAYWDAMASNLEGQADAKIHAFKINLARRGLTQGDGSSMALAPNAVGCVGITLHAASVFRAGIGMFPLGGVNPLALASIWW